MRPLLLGVLLLATACATTRAAEDEDDARLARDADKGPAPATTTDDEGAPAPAPKKSAAPPQAKKSSSGNVDANAAMAEAMAAAGRMQAAAAEADAECAKLEGRPIPFAEERLMGTFTALQVAAKGKGLVADETATYVQTVGHWVAAGSARPDIPWTFGVVDDASSAVHAAQGGWVFVTTGLLAQLQNEAQLAAALASGIAPISTRALVNDYASSKVKMCRINLTGAGLVAAGAANVPGGQEFTTSSKFNKSMKKFSSPNWFEDDPEVDVDFIEYMASRISDMQLLTGLKSEDQQLADRAALELLASAGYDARVYSEVLGLIGARPERKAAVEKLPKGEFGTGAGGKAPAFPKGVKLK